MAAGEAGMAPHCRTAILSWSQAAVAAEVEMAMATAEQVEVTKVGVVAGVMLHFQAALEPLDAPVPRRTLCRRGCSEGLFARASR